MQNYVAVRCKAPTMAALRVALSEGETMDGLLRRLLVTAGYESQSKAADPLVSPPRPESMYADLGRVLVGRTVLIKWRGPRDKWGAVTQSQAWLYNAVTRAEKRYGVEFQRRDNGEGLLLTRVR